MRGSQIAFRQVGLAQYQANESAPDVEDRVQSQPHFAHAEKSPVGFHLKVGMGGFFQPDDALDLLEPMSREPLSQRDRLRVEALRADAWIQKQDPARAVQLMMQRETWITDRHGIEQNRKRLWQGLLVSSPQVLRRDAETATNPIVRGWLLIGSLATSTGQQGVGWSNGVLRWREANSNHPAMTVLGDLQLPENLLLVHRPAHH